MLDNVQWNVDGDTQYSSDGNLLMVDEMNHQHLIEEARREGKKKGEENVL